ncbi:hypothetical protein HJFPF1_04694 [Paramyrothecium foliicola]|nr:hypothetical protein HJFPF1_04694 [Paramyrothecium foliicola]
MGWFDGKGTSSPQANVASGAEQDRLESHFGDKAPSIGDVAGRLPRTSTGAEQEIWGKTYEHTKLPSLREVGDKLPHTPGSEQEIYQGHFSGKLPSTNIGDKLPQGSAGAEQEIYGSHFSDKLPPTGIPNRLPRSSGAEQDRYGQYFGNQPSSPINPTFVGLLQSAVLPSFGFHAGLSLVGYGVARATNRAEGKDWLWPTGMIANSWWSAIGSRVVYDGLSVPEAWSTLTYPQKLVLAGASAWGLRLFYRIATRSAKRGKDDARYDEPKREPGFWNKALFTLFLPEAAVQTLISLPFTLPFRAPLHSALSSPVFGNASLLHGLSVFLFSTGFALEVLADAQLASHKQKNPQTLNRDGVWSIVRHPNYLGDALIHASFPILLLGAGIMHPLVLAGPAINYFFLRFVGGDRENEANQEERYAKENPLKAQELAQYKQEKNSFWPSVEELQNKWTWFVLAAGAGGAVLEQVLRSTDGTITEFKSPFHSKSSRFATKRSKSAYVEIASSRLSAKKSESATEIPMNTGSAGRTAVSVGASHGFVTFNVKRFMGEGLELVISAVTMVIVRLATAEVANIFGSILDLLSGFGRKYEWKHT